MICHLYRSYSIDLCIFQLRCCGVEQAADWKTAADPRWDQAGGIFL